MVGSNQVCAYCASTLLMVLLAIASAVIIYLAVSDFGIDFGIFENSTRDRANEYVIDATPADWAFSIWGFVFLFELLWIVYAITTLFRSNEDGPIYYVAPVLPPGFMLMYSLNQALLGAWLFLFDMEYISFCCLDAFVISLTGIVCLIINHRRVEDNLDYMKEYLLCDLIANRVLVENGIALYTTWTIILTLLNGVVGLSYEELVGLDQSVSSTIMYGAMVFLLGVYFILDVTALERFLRYTFTPYIVVIAASLGSLNLEFEADDPASVFQMIAIGLGGFFLILKFFCTLCHQRRSWNYE